MKKILPILLVAFSLIYVSSCEKDDICVDGDTPLLVIGFYDAIDTTVFKSVPLIRIKGIDNDSILTTDSFNDRSNSPDSLLIPLRIDGISTTYEVITDSADDETTMEETGNRDTLSFNYSVSEQFISRACGFVANYNTLTIGLTTDDSNWIQNITVVEDTIENSNNIHVKIFH
ncbi:hypothetical protein DKG77_14465 [Flagellimonas aquimarina]|uniref:Uncharacterized protein n=1 Tax=Flagellimonas aquimarina TaxID=2201895 RepID=A0A316KTH0_9FLAO|nr:DUF6452 family protein [Allomuricauda koreensis]PWL37512.1 hypothetical protein DKG77_14465 [Allomuricauda koreensis]